MKYLLLVTVAILMSGCATKFSQPPQPTDTNRLFEEAHNCEGAVRYQAELYKGELRTRLSCQWNVTDEHWGVW